MSYLGERSLCFRQRFVPAYGIRVNYECLLISSKSVGKAALTSPAVSRIFHLHFQKSDEMGNKVKAVVAFRWEGEDPRGFPG